MNTIRAIPSTLLAIAAFAVSPAALAQAGAVTAATAVGSVTSASPDAALITAMAQSAVDQRMSWRNLRKDFLVKNAGLDKTLTLWGVTRVSTAGNQCAYVEDFNGNGPAQLSPIGPQGAGVTYYTGTGLQLDNTASAMAVPPPGLCGTADNYLRARIYIPADASRVCVKWRGPGGQTGNQCVDENNTSTNDLSKSGFNWGPSQVYSNYVARLRSASGTYGSYKLTNIVLYPDKVVLGLGSTYQGTYIQSKPNCDPARANCSMTLGVSQSNDYYVLNQDHIDANANFLDYQNKGSNYIYTGSDAVQ